MKRKMCQVYNGAFVSFPFLECIIKESYHIIFDILRLLHHIRHNHITDMDTFGAIIIKIILFLAFSYLSAGTSIIDMLLHRMMHDLANKYQ